MPISGKEMLKRFKKAGLKVLQQKGSHVQVEKDGEIETIPLHGNKDLKKGLERKLLKRLE